MFGFMAPVWALFNPLWALLAARTWICAAAIAGISLLLVLLRLPVTAAFMAGMLGLLLMWKSEHDQAAEGPRA
ncbi:hypothetical protein [Roseomonas sp. 18066]|uniref:hypothetical protein n=1 Tax=Roseomonas sp. 18066 TaxID=2681412 RepID=UPI0013583A5D|nr:hypothetical protein [Roseomonas sp. 18066]